MNKDTIKGKFDQVVDKGKEKNSDVTGNSQHKTSNKQNQKDTYSKSFNEKKSV